MTLEKTLEQIIDIYKEHKHEPAVGKVLIKQVVQEFMDSDPSPADRFKFAMLILVAIECRHAQSQDSEVN